jgi:hypothetical protein
MYLVIYYLPSALSAFTWPILSRSRKTYPLKHCGGSLVLFHSLLHMGVGIEPPTHTTRGWIAYHLPMPTLPENHIHCTLLFSAVLRAISNVFWGLFTSFISLFKPKSQQNLVIYQSFKHSQLIAKKRRLYCCYYTN